ncbi:hypothetical protein [Natroniella sp. ANB-PHB2]|uniref:hypothetical protein n=1 Tax=Natroniella sp. ANB-PHB2 TaxID=3384444 RepID=UPI0038D40E8D
MIIIEDEITLGIFAGIIANIIRNIVGFISYFIGLQDYHIWQFAASAYLSIEEAKSYGIIVGGFTDYMLATMVSIFAVYFFLYVGFKNYLLKGLLIGGFAWISIFTLAVRTGISRIDPNSVAGSLSFLFNHLLLGVLIALLLKKYGDQVF